MKVKELQKLLQKADPQGEVLACEYGYRSSALLDTQDACVQVDPREHDDWGNPKREPGDPNPANLYIRLGNCGDNRYPPAGVFGEPDEDGEFLMGRMELNPDDHPSKQAADRARIEQYQHQRSLDEAWDAALRADPDEMQEVIDRAFIRIVEDEPLLNATLNVHWEQLAPLYGMEM